MIFNCEVKTQTIMHNLSCYYSLKNHFYLCDKHINIWRHNQISTICNIQFLWSWSKLRLLSISLIYFPISHLLNLVYYLATLANYEIRHIYCVRYMFENIQATREYHTDIVLSYLLVFKHTNQHSYCKSMSTILLGIFNADGFWKPLLQHYVLIYNSGKTLLLTPKG